ncbi:hypothetical protein [Dactylosporangium sp. CA-139066]|uniref:hypothetical protein n=1 Tax=Dactylosporangium sp. CA-139066 TaxID=3239930 RepID=UPI003D8CB7F4
MRVNDAFMAHYNQPRRARLRGLARNPELHGERLLRVLEHPERVRISVFSRPHWTEEAFATLAAHPDRQVRVDLAEAGSLPPPLRARLVDDPEASVRAATITGPSWRPYWERREPTLPHWAYERLAGDPSERVLETLRSTYSVPAQFRDPPAPPAAQELDLEALARSEVAAERLEAARAPGLPAELVARLAADPVPSIRLAVSMRRELTEQQRAAIDYEVRPADRIRAARWAATTDDPDELRRCVESAHIGLRRSVAYNRNLSPAQIEVLAADPDFAVRLLLCENHREVPGDLVLATYLESRVITAPDMLRHPSFPRRGLAARAGDENPRIRALVHLDPDASPALIDRLSRDEHPQVRAWSAGDPRLTAARVLELLEDPETASGAASNPNLPEAAMDAIIAEAHDIVDDYEGTPTVMLGRPPETD